MLTFIARDRDLTLQAPTAARPATSKFAECSRHHRTAVTAAFPARGLPEWTRQQALCSQSAEPLSTKIHPWSFRDSAIAGLLAPRRPAAIIGAVRAVVVISFDRVSWRGARPHVEQECREAVQPSIADADATAAVARVRLLMWVIATAFDACPDSILRCDRPTSRSSVRCGWHARILSRRVS